MYLTNLCTVSSESRYPVGLHAHFTDAGFVVILNGQNVVEKVAPQVAQAPGFADIQFDENK